MHADAHGSIDCAFGMCIVQITNCRDMVSANRHVSRVPWIPSSVDDVTVDDEDVVLRLLVTLSASRGWEQSKRRK